MKYYIFAIIALIHCAIKTEVISTRYGTFVLSEPRKKTIFQHIINASTCHFGEVSCAQKLSNKEQIIFDAYISAKDPVAQLLNLATKVRIHNWHPAYHKAIEALITCSKELKN